MDKPYYIFLKRKNKIIIKNLKFINNSLRFIKIRITYKNYNDELKIVQSEYIYEKNYFIDLNEEFFNIDIKNVINLQIFYEMPIYNINNMIYSVIIEEYKNEENYNKIKEICDYNKEKLKIMREEVQ